jgi:MFS transporter, OPA family, glycerol-3-phosphate transporter
MQRGVGWRMVFFAAGGVLGAIAVVAWVALRDSPAEVGLSEPAVSGGNVYGAAGASSKPRGLADLLIPFLRSPSFWAIAAVSFALTLIRESFNAWTPTYLVDVYGLTQADAAQKSSLFPFIGGISVLMVGRLSDRAAPNLRLAITVPLLVLAIVALMLLGSAVALESQTIGLLLLGAVAFLLIGPHSLLAGAMAVDLGARRGSATAAGLIDSAGYLGAVFAGWGIGALAEGSGWTMAFRMLAGVAAVAVAATLVYWRLQRPRQPRGALS